MTSIQLPTLDLTALDRRAALHTENCTAARVAQASWDARWPNACATCSGAGVVVSSYDPSPSGISLSPGSMTDEEPCSCITDRHVCPRCARPWPGPLRYQSRYRLAHYLTVDLDLQLYAAWRTVRRWQELLLRLSGVRLGAHASRRITAPGGLLVMRLSGALAALGARLWPGILDGENEPACGWCGWSGGHAPGDTRPAWECSCAESEAAAGRRCSRCMRIFTPEFPALQIKGWGVSPERVHRSCLFEDDRVVEPTA